MNYLYCSASQSENRFQHLLDDLLKGSMQNGWAIDNEKKNMIYVNFDYKFMIMIIHCSEILFQSLHS